MQKNATPNKSQQEVLRRRGLNPLYFVIVKDMANSMIVKNRDTGEFQII